MPSILQDIWHGLWTGFGVELSVLVLWLGWTFTHSKLGHRFHADHLFHRIGDYINK